MQLDGLDRETVIRKEEGRRSRQKIGRGTTLADRDTEESP